jgi:hypothetical protein
MAKPSCDWIEGSLRVELAPIERGTQLTIMEDLGGGVRELVFPRLLLDAPFGEFERSLKLASRAVEPLQLQKSGPDKIILAHRRARASLKPPSFELAEDCLRSSLPATVRNTLPPAAPANGPKPTAERELAQRRRVRPREETNERREPLPLLEVPRLAKVLDFSQLEPDAPPTSKSEKPPRKR